MPINKSLVTIGWGTNNPLELTDAKEPSAYSITTSTLVDSGTSVSGKLLGSVVRNDVIQISLSWNYLSAQDWAEINEPFNKEYINKIRFFDQTTNDWNNRNMYISDRGAGMYQFDGENQKVGWTGCSLKLTEV
jgi:hypothetical protein